MLMLMLMKRTGIGLDLRKLKSFDNVHFLEGAHLEAVAAD